MTQSLKSLLNSGAQQLGIVLSETQLDQLLQFLELILKWNRTHNLTAITQRADMVTKHLLDSLSVLPYIKAGRLLDVGSGAGLPVVPLAIAAPALNCTALDASHKRVVFIRHAVQQLNIPNIQAVHSRVEDYVADPYDVITCRAFSGLPVFINSTRHLLAEQGYWLAMKGNDPADEKAALPEGIAVVEDIALTIPGLDASRHLIRLQRECDSRVEK